MYPKTDPVEKDEYKENQYLQTVKKSNFLISAKFKSHVVDNKLLLLSLKAIEDGHYEVDSAGQIIVEMKAASLRKALGKKGGGLYQTLQDAAARMTTKSIGIENEEGFDYFTFTNRAKYINETSTFIIRFAAESKIFLADLQNNYTRLSLTTLLNVSSNYSFRLFEVIRSRAFLHPNDPRWKETFGASELKFLLGAINPDDEAVKAVLKRTGKKNGAPDYEKAEAAAKDYIYKNWSSFKQNCLDVAIKELNDPEKKTGMNIRYDTHRSGRGGKISSVTFYVDMIPDQKGANNPGNYVETPRVTESEELPEEMLCSLYDQTRELMAKENISTYEAKKIVEAANNDWSKIKEKYQIACGTKSIDNIVGWMIAALKEGYEPPKRKAGRPRKNAFHNFDERDTDYNEILKDLY